ncbi:XRE family transcriptional regulator [Agarivorans sp. OAG1]|uniref:bifunctional transcriptional activator/DNA repair enzyme AdaA n=1 Tax=Agarivorans sp. OAG1 TaxID=3082387 RepID=UPI002B29AD30|nr:XRE family transcriptional regulator [Agarivorans sp. OAG1]
MKALSFQQKYQAMSRKDAQYEGVFYTAVKTTGIFCRPSCRARKPKIENVVFYDTVQEALQHGYRACKVCKPMQPLDAAPLGIKQLLDNLQQDNFTRIQDGDLRERGLDPAQVRRWFKKHHGITFHAYQRMLRINSAFSQIQQGDSVSNSAFDSGYESLSGFNDSYKKVFGGAPSEQNKAVINIVRFTTPIGPMYACATDKGLCLLEFTDRRMLETEFADLTKRLKAVILPGDNPHLDQVQQEIAEYFAGSRKQFDVALDTPSTEFRQKVWRGLMDIPYAETRSYGQQAEYLQIPNAVRAVASANGQNRISIIIPCHRVVGANGQLTGYGGGIHRKDWLLKHEQANR